jgi:hypothetical protein
VREEREEQKISCGMHDNQRMSGDDGASKQAQAKQLLNSGDDHASKQAQASTHTTVVMMRCK